MVEDFTRVPGLVLGVLAAAVTAAVALPWLPSIDAPSPGGAALLEILVGGLLFAMLWGALGVGLGALIPNQAAAVAGVLLWWLMIEPALGSLVPVINSLARWALRRAGYRTELRRPADVDGRSCGCGVGGHRAMRRNPARSSARCRMIEPGVACRPT